MIIYENENRVFDGKNYDRTYSEEPEHFTHKVTFEAISKIINSYLKLKYPFYCLDLGCGQGQVLAKVKEELENRQEQVNYSKLYGIDISKVAIEQCEQKYHDLSWIVDSFQDFYIREETKTQLFNKFDLVINKGGLTAVKTQREYEEMLEAINSLLDKNGKYLFIKNKKFYEKWKQSRCQTWSEDIFEIALKTFKRCEKIDNNSYYINIYSQVQEVFYTQVEFIKEGYNEIENKAIKIELVMSNGTVSSLELTDTQLVDSFWKRLREPVNKNQVFVYEVPMQYSDRAKGVYLELLNRINNNFQVGKKKVLCLNQRLQIGAEIYDHIPELFSKLEAIVNLVYFPILCNNSRKYCDYINDWLLAQPEIIILGFDLDDYKLEQGNNKPVVDLDEFAYRIDYIFAKMFDRDVKIVWISLPVIDFKNDNSHLYYDVNVFRQYNCVVSDIAKNYGNVEILDFNSELVSEVSKKQIKDICQNVIEKIDDFINLN